MISCDVLVAGRGVAGCATAIALRRRGLSVVLAQSVDGIGGFGAELLDGSARAFGESIGLDEFLACSDALALVSVRASWGDSDVYEHCPIRGGWFVDKQQLAAVLAANARDLGVVFVDRDVAAIEPTIGWRWSIGFRGTGDDARAAFVVDATGRRATVASLLGVTRLTRDRMVAVVSTGPSRRGSPLAAKLHLEAAQSGWWYAAPSPPGSLTSAFVTVPDPLGPHTAANLWAEGLRTAPMIRALLDESGPIGAVVGRNASVSQLVSPAGEGWLAVGDASAQYDPLSGQGLAHALQTAVEGATAIELYLAGSDLRLARYAATELARCEKHLMDRAVQYGSATRWQNERFWLERLRRPTIKLQPTTVLQSSTDHSLSPALFVSSGRIPDLVAEFRAPKPAHEGLSAFRASVNGLYQDAALVSLAQMLIDCGELRVVAE